MGDLGVGMEFGRHQSDSWDTRGAHFFAFMMVGLVVAACFNTPKTHGDATALAASACQDWDQEAVEGITHLISDTRAAAELKLNEALAQLRRARLYCRGGSITVARSDYDSLHRAFPVTTGSIRTAPSAASDRPITKTSLPK